MQELVGRLTALDPQASEGLKVIAYFDALVDGHAGAEILLRGAAVLSGCAAGFTSNSASNRVDSTGLRDAATAAPLATVWPSHPVAGGGFAWIERAGDPHANDAMILERLAIAVGIMLERSAPVVAMRRAVETVLDTEEPVDRRRAAAKQLRLDPAQRFAVVAEPASTPPLTGDHQTVIVTAHGDVRAIIRPADRPLLETRAGVGEPTAPDNLDASWESALTALRLTSESVPVVRAGELGSLLLLARAADASATEPADVATVRALVHSSPRTLALLESLVSSESLRAAATELGLHHSTVQAKTTELTTTLGFDPRTPQGRTRLSLAVSLYRLATNRF